MPGVTQHITALLPQAVLVPPALTPVQPEQFSCVQHLKQLSRQNDSPALRSWGCGSGVVVQSWPHRTSQRQRGECLLHHRRRSAQLIFEHVRDCFDPRNIKNQGKTLLHAVLFHDFPALPPALALLLLLAKMLWIFWVRGSTQTQLAPAYTNWSIVFCPESNISHFKLDPGAKSCLLEQQEQQELMSVMVHGNDGLGNPSCRGSAVSF